MDFEDSFSPAAIKKSLTLTEKFNANGYYSEKTVVLRDTLNADPPAPGTPARARMLREAKERGLARPARAAAQPQALPETHDTRKFESQFAPIVFGHTMNPTLEKAPTLDPAAPNPAPPASDPAACAALLQKLGFNPNGDLCKRVPRPSKTNAFNQTTAMYEAANVGDLGLCRFIFEQSERRRIALGTKQGGASAIKNKSNRCSSPFHVACWRGHLAVAQWLFKTSVDAGLIDCDFFEGPSGRTPMHLACSSGQLEIARWLLNIVHVDVHLAHIRAKDSEGSTPMHLASHNAHLDVMKWLFEAGYVEDIHTKDSLGWTPADVAISRGHKAVVRWLESVGGGTLGGVSAFSSSDPWARGMRLLYADSKEGRDDFANHFAFFALHIKDNKGRTPLLLACQEGRMDVAQWILATFDAEDIRARYNDDMTLMHHACSNGHLDVAKWLFDLGAAGDIRAQDNRGRTPMLVACEDGHLDVARWLFKVGAANDICTKGKYGVLPMYIACVHGHLAVAKWLFSVGAEVCSPAMRWRQIRQPLVIGCPEVALWLLQNGAAHGDGHIDCQAFLCEIPKIYHEALIKSLGQWAQECQDARALCLSLVLPAMRSRTCTKALRGRCSCGPLACLAGSSNVRARRLMFEFAMPLKAQLQCARDVLDVLERKR